MKFIYDYTTTQLLGKIDTQLKALQKHNTMCVIRPVGVDMAVHAEGAMEYQELLRMKQQLLKVAVPIDIEF